MLGYHQLLSKKGFDNEKGACIISCEEVPCEQVFSPAFQAEREKVCINSAPGQEHGPQHRDALAFSRGDSEIICWSSAKIISLPPPQASGIHRSDDQCSLMEGRSRMARVPKRIIICDNFLLIYSKVLTI